MTHHFYKLKDFCTTGAQNFRSVGVGVDGNAPPWQWQ